MQRELVATAGGSSRVELNLPVEAPVPPGPLPTPAPAAHHNANWVPYALGGLTVLGAVTWVGFWSAANNNRSDARTLRSQLGGYGCTDGSAQPSTCQHARDTYDAQHRNATISYVGAGVTAVGGIATLGYLLFMPRARQETGSFNMRPVVTVERAGGFLAVNGTF